MFSNQRAALALLALIGGCARDGERAPSTELQIAPARTPAPAPADHGARCLDVGEARACWDEAAADSDPCLRGRCVVSKPLPQAREPAAGFRCSGQGSARVCDDRARHGGVFACDGARCIQQRPRTPDNGEWECAELAGASLCLHVSDAAGIDSGPVDPAFVCGVRRGTESRVCVDFAPDRPRGAAAWACRVSYTEGAAARICTPTSAVRLGDRCASTAACPDGALCVAGTCLPARPMPNCWVDSDCGGGTRCRWGTCDERA